MQSVSPVAQACRCEVPRVRPSCLSRMCQWELHIRGVKCLDTYIGKSFHTHSSRAAHSIISCSVGSLPSSSGESGATGVGGGPGRSGEGGGCCPRILNRTMSRTKDASTLAMNFSRGMHIWILDGLRQKSCFGGDQLGGGDSRSCCSARRPISDRLPLIVKRLVMESGTEMR